MKEFFKTLFIGIITLPVVLLVLYVIPMLAIKPIYILTTIILVLVTLAFGLVTRMIFEDTINDFIYWVKRKWRNRKRNDR